MAVRDLLAGGTPSAIAIGSTARIDDTFMESLDSIGPVLELNGGSPSPVVNEYATRTTLGADRLANVTGVARRFPGRSAMVIDAGTCVTYDVLENDMRYAGGAISPGMRMRAKAMHAYSARLPEVHPGHQVPALGTSTESSLASGIHHGLVGEMREFIRAFGTERPEMVVVLTGGDGLRFASALENGIFALPFLTLEGYNALLNHHRTLHGGTLAAGSSRGKRTGSAG